MYASGQSPSKTREASHGSLEKSGRFWIASWPTRAAKPKAEKPRIVESIVRGEELRFL